MDTGTTGTVACSLLIQSVRTAIVPDATNQSVALVADDNSFIVMEAVDILEAAGFRCFEANSGDHARIIIERHHDLITLLFSDIEMPGETDGVGLAWYVADRYPSVEILLASGRYKTKEGELPPHTTFIGKPFSAAIVHEHLAQKLPPEKKPEPLKNAD